MTDTVADIAKSLQQDGDILKGQDGLIFDPFNSNNHEITQAQVETILQEYGVPSKVHNINLYKRAFIHKSYVKRPHLENKENNITIVDKPNNCLTLKTKSNERLEFLGDGVLECITKYYLYRRFPKGNEGFMTEKKIALVKNESIGKMAYDMGINKWYIMSKNAEEKKTRTNLKKLGCLFEAFLGALFLDFNKIDIKDEHSWFENVFVTGPGFQIAQIFVEGIFEKHVNWTELLENDDNYKNILQVLIQKEFKTTPVYVEISQQDEDTGYHMGVYLCIGQHHHNLNHSDSLSFSNFNSFSKIQEYMQENDKIYVFFADSKHKIKKKAEQQACKLAIDQINKCN
jgi:dsRNA-specific ribonuclease